MPKLEFKEISPANIANGKQDTFELFAREFLEYVGYNIISEPNRGPDGGKDLIVLEVREGILGAKTEVKWLVSCKHKAHSGDSVISSDEYDIPQRIKQHDCKGFIGFYSTVVSSPLANKFDGLKKEYEIRHFDNEKIEKELFEKPAGFQIAKRYFPESLKNLSTEDYYLSVKKRQLSLFQSLNSFIERSGEYLPDAELFDNELYFFPPKELKFIENIKSIITSDNNDRLALLIGDPASGKTVMSIKIAKDLEAQGYKTFFHRITSRSNYDLIWKDISSNDIPRTLYVFENCHLNIEIINHLFVNFDRIKNSSCLFVTRDLPKKLRYSDELDNLDIFEKLKNQKIFLSLSDKTNTKLKIKGIVEKYKKYYEHNVKSKLITGNLDRLIHSTNRNLLTLYFFLQYWPKATNLEEIHLNVIFPIIYDKFLLHDKTEHLLKYACLFQYEIQFEPSEDEKNDVEWLLRKGVISYDIDTGLYKFFHSDFALLLLKACQSRPSFRRKYHSLEDFTYLNIEEYILSFEKYPSILEDIFINLIGKNEIKTVVRLLENGKILQKTIEFYKQYGSIENLLSLFFRMQFINYSVVKKLFHEMPIDVWVNRLRRFGFSGFARCLIRLKLIDTEKPKILLNKFDKSSLIEKAKKTNFSTLGNALIELNKIDNTLQIGTEIFNELETDYFFNWLQNSTFEHIGKNLCELSKLNGKKTNLILERANLESLVVIAKSSNIKALGKTLNELKSINFKLALTLYRSINLEVIKGKCKTTSLEGLGRALNELNNIDRNKTVKLFNSVEIDLFKKLSQRASFDQIAHSLSELKNVHAARAREIYYNLDVQFLCEKANDKRLSIQKIGAAFLELRNLDLKGTKIKEIVNNIDKRYLSQKTHYSRFSQICIALNGFSKIDSSFSDNLFGDLNFNSLIKKAKRERFDHLCNSLNLLKNINYVKAEKLFSKLDLYPYISDCADLSFDKIANSLSNLFNFDKEKTAKFYRMIDINLLIRKAKNTNYNVLNQCFGKLKKVDYAITYKIKKDIGFKKQIRKSNKANTADAKQRRA